MQGARRHARGGGRCDATPRAKVRATPIHKERPRRDAGERAGKGTAARTAGGRCCAGLSAPVPGLAAPSLWRRGLAMLTRRTRPSSSAPSMLSMAAAASSSRKNCTNPKPRFVSAGARREGEAGGDEGRRVRGAAAAAGRGARMMERRRRGYRGREATGL